MGFETSSFKLTTGAGSYKTLKSDSSGTANWSNFYTTPSGTYTIGTDFATIQAAIDRMAQSVIEGPVVISVPSGTYNGGIELNYMPYGKLVTVVGDTRTAAVQSQSSSDDWDWTGGHLTIILEETPPADFTSSDYVIISGVDPSGNRGRFQIVSINTGTKTIVVEAPDGEGTTPNSTSYVTFCPNRILRTSGLSAGNNLVVQKGAQITLQGFTLINENTSGSGFQVLYNGMIFASQTAIYGMPTDGVESWYGGFVDIGNTKNSIIQCGNGGAQAMFHGTVKMEDCLVSQCAQGIQSFYGSTILAQRAKSFYSTIGFCSGGMSTIHADNAYSQGNSYGWYSYDNSYIYAPSTIANTYNNSVLDYSPAVSGTEGNNAGVLVFS